MFNLGRNMDFRTINMLIRFYSITRKSHYDVLRLRRNCTDKEIKEAFIKLSKEYHPDKNKDENAQQHFVKIVEAYNVLGKPSSRAQYDSRGDYNPIHSPVYRTRDNIYNMRQAPRRNNFYWNYNKTKSESSNEKPKAGPYYGIKGLKRVPNSVLIFLCVGIAIIGAALQAIVIRKLYFVHKEQMLERSRQLAEELEKVRSAAKGNSNEMQTRMLLEKIVGSSNSTIATASLGQSLATEKKEPNAISEADLTQIAEMEIQDVSNFLYPIIENSTEFSTISEIISKIRMYYYYYTR